MIISSDIKKLEKTFFYQIYPKSFCDSDNNGEGDLRGIISKLDYLKELGIDAVWVSPCYQSPNDDCGYDISDYRKIGEEYGTMEDFDLLVSELHSRNMALLMDLVVNHTSDEHIWFQKSRKRDPKYENYYIWKNAGEIGEGEANFGGSVWQYDEERKQYYLHLFSKKQPDLNWDNPDVRKDISDMVNFWLDKGVDGFRCDVIYLISKYEEHPETGFGPHLHEYLHELWENSFSRRDAVTVAEVWGQTPEQSLELTAPERKELTMAFAFDHMSLGRTGRFAPAPFSPDDFVTALASWQNGVNERGINTLVLENHDQPRILSRYGSPDRYPAESAKLLALLTYCMKGASYIYQGQELGLKNPVFDDPDGFADIETIEFIAENRKNLSPEELLEKANFGTRDAGRVFFPWDGENGSEKENAWLRAKCGYTKTNVKSEKDDPDSVLSFYKKLIKEKKTNDVLAHGDFRLLENSDGYFVYRRTLSEKAVTVAGNFSEKPREVENVFDGRLLLSSYHDTDLSGKTVKLRPYEAFALEG